MQYLQLSFNRTAFAVSLLATLIWVLLIGYAAWHVVGTFVDFALA